VFQRSTVYQEFNMIRTLSTLRTSVAVGAFALAIGALHSAHAADAAEQRVAMAYTHGSDAAQRKQPMQSRQATAAARAELALAKAPARRAQAQHDLRDSDGSRFTYDSCGCSN
jgi:hypothetical protein